MFKLVKDSIYFNHPQLAGSIFPIEQHTLDILSIVHIYKYWMQQLPNSNQGFYTISQDNPMPNTDANYPIHAMPQSPLRSDYEGSIFDFYPPCILYSKEFPPLEMHGLLLIGDI